MNNDDENNREQQARLLLDAIQNPIPLQVTNLFSIRWETAPEGFECPRCKSTMERSRGLAISGPWAGAVRCTKCEYRDSVVGYLGKSIVQILQNP